MIWTNLLIVAPFILERIMEMHEHIQCEHEIKYCKVCDVCYCEKCGKQWSSFTFTYTPTTYVGTDTYPKITYVANHVHGKDLE